MFPLMILDFVKHLTFVKAPGISVYNNNGVFVVICLLLNIVKFSDILYNYTTSSSSTKLTSMIWGFYI